MDEVTPDDPSPVQVQDVHIVNSNDVFYNTIEISAEDFSQQLENAGKFSMSDDSSFKFQIIGAGDLENYKLVDLEQVQNLNDQEVIIINADNLQIESNLSDEVRQQPRKSSSVQVKKKESLKPKFILPHQPHQVTTATTTTSQPNFILTSVDGKTFHLTPANQSQPEVPTSLGTFQQQNQHQQQLNNLSNLQASVPQVSLQYMLPQNLTVLSTNNSQDDNNVQIVGMSQGTTTVQSATSAKSSKENDDTNVPTIIELDDEGSGDSEVRKDNHSSSKQSETINTVSYVVTSEGQSANNAGNTINVNVPGMPGVVCQMQRYLFSQGLCRVCLLSKSDLVSIFEDVNITSNGLIENSRGPHAANRYNIIPAIKTLLDIDVNFGDGLPEQICLECIDNLTSFSVFRKRIALGQGKLHEILAQVQGTSNPTVIPELGELDMKRTDIFRHADSIIQAKQILKSSNYSHFVVRSLSDRVLEKIFQSLAVMVGYKSGKLKNLEAYAVDTPYASGWFCYACNLTLHGPKEVFAEHNVTVHGVRSADEVLFPCDICAQSFVLQDKSGISQSYAEHWLQHFFFYECVDCSKRMPSQKGLWVHKRSAHTSGQKDFSCTMCDKSFFKKAHLDAHKKTHLDPEERKRNWCKLCGKGLTSSLAAHMASVHTNDRPWKCEICNKQFKRREILNGHRETVHFNLKKYQCQICGEYLKSHSTKTLHVLRHKGEKPHACSVCDKRFYSAHSMKSHMVKHQNVGKVKCTICGKIFKRKMYLVEHMRLHTGEKPHECHICGKQIRMKSNFFKHLKVHKRREAEIMAKEITVVLS